MECVCECGREVPGALADRNFLAASVALELLAWDKNRFLAGPTPEGDDLIARGATCYQRELATLHGEATDASDDATQAWLDESVAHRSPRKGLSRWKLFGVGPPNLSDDDMARLDRHHPETSFTGGRAPAEHRAPASGGRDPIEDLERLHALHRQGALSESEFAAAKSRLLGDG